MICDAVNRTLPTSIKFQSQSMVTVKMWFSSTIVFGSLIIQNLTKMVFQAVHGSKHIESLK